VAGNKLDQESGLRGGRPVRSRDEKWPEIGLQWPRNDPTLTANKITRITMLLAKLDIVRQ